MYGDDPTTVQQMIQGIVKYGYDADYVLMHPPWEIEFIIWESIVEEIKRKNEQLQTISRIAGR